MRGGQTIRLSDCQSDMGPENVSPFTASHVEQGDFGGSLRCARNDEAQGDFGGSLRLARNEGGRNGYLIQKGSVKYFV